MAFCSSCGGEVSLTAAYCRHCGGSLDDPVGANSDAEPARDRGGCRKVFKWIAICFAGLVGAFIILIIVVAILTDTDENGSASTETTPVPAGGVDATVGATDGTIVVALPETSSPTATSLATATPIPTATPSPEPIEMTLSDLLDAYDQNSVRANAKLRYRENGNIPVSTSGYVSEVNELYVSITATRDEYSLKELACYYADVGAALHLTKGQSVSVTGRISGTGSVEDLFSALTMFACEFDGLPSTSYPTISAQQVQSNVVQVFCRSGSIFSPSYKGTGVIIDPEGGIILTVHHVVADENECESIEVEVPGLETPIPASIIKHCASIDRARLRVSPETLDRLPLQPVYKATAPAQKDQEIYFWGYGPGELRKETGFVQDTWGQEIITDAYAVPGDSGSPVFNENGHLVGTMSRSNRSDRALFTGDECE
jgi:S1-C subfamily serine protease